MRGAQMAKTISRLARVAMGPLNSDSVALTLTNEHRKDFKTAITPEGLNALLTPLLKCIGLWAAKPALLLVQRTRLLLRKSHSRKAEIQQRSLFGCIWATRVKWCS